MVDIILVNYNSTCHVLRCLESVYTSLQEVPAKIFVQDNDSCDDVDRVNSAFPEVYLSKNKGNIGFARAVNAAIAQGSSPYLVLLNPDTMIIDSVFFSNVILFMEENRDVGILGPKILNDDGSVQGSARNFPSVLTGLFGRNCLFSRCLPGNALSRKDVVVSGLNGQKPKEVEWVSGACMVVRRKAVDDVGPLDERFFMYWEDADWCRRMWQSGWRVVYFPSRASVVHYIGGSSRNARCRSLVEFHRSAYRLFAKYASGPERLLKPLALWALALRLLVLLVWNGLGDVIRVNRTGRGCEKGALGRGQDVLSGQGER